MSYGVNGSRIQTGRKRIVDQPARHTQHIRSMHLVQPEPLQSSKIIDVSQLASQLFKDCPISVARLRPKLAGQMLSQIRLHRIVVEQRIINVEQEDDFGVLEHFFGKVSWLRLPVLKY